MPSPPNHDLSVSDNTDAAAVSPSVSVETDARREDNLGTILRSIGDAVLVTDADGNVTLLNPVAERLTGWTNRDAHGQSAGAVFDLIHETTREPVESLVARVLRDGGAVGLADPTILRRRDGSEVPIDDSAAPVRDDAGRLVGVVLVFRDISDRRTGEAALRVAEERLRLATQGANIGTWDLDLINDTLFWDARCRAAFDYPLALPIDYPTCLSLIHPDDRPAVEEAVASALAPGGLGKYVVEYRTIGYQDGVERWVQVEGKALFDATNTATRFLGTIQDVSEHKRFEEELRETRIRLESALLAGEIATWTFDIVNDRVVADPNLARLFSVDPDAAVSGELDVYLAAIHPDDRARVTEIIRNAIENDDEYEAEYRVLLPDGRARWLVARGKVQRDAGGVALALPGVVLDITARKEAADALAGSEARFRVQADAMPQMVWATDPQGNHLYYNRRWYDYTGQTVEESMGFGFALALHPDDLERTLYQWRLAWEGGQDYDIEYRFRRFDGTYRWFVGRAEPIHDPQTGAVTMWAGTCTDIDELKRTQERQRFLSDLTERTRLLMEPDTVIAETVEAAGTFLGLSRLLYAEINESTDLVRVYPDWCGNRQDGGSPLPSAAGRWTREEWGRTIAPWGTTPGELREGRTVVIRDFATDPRTAAAFAEISDRLTIRAAVRIPRLRGGEWVAMMSAQSSLPRDWTPEEIDLLEAVAERLWLTLENIRLFRETQMRAEREALVNLVGTAIRSSPLDIQAILQAAVIALGEGLQADRCYYAVYDQANDLAQVDTEWHSADLAPMVGQDFRMSAYSVDRDPEYRAGQIHVVSDVVAYSPDHAGPLLQLGIRSLLRVPLQIGNRMTSLAVAFSGEPHYFSRGEIRVVETVASQLQSALDAARLLTAERQRAEREHLVNEIGEAVRSSSEPDEMQAILVERLGRALGADRCFVSLVDAVRDLFVVVRDFRADEAMPSLAGRHRLSDYAAELDILYPHRRTLILPDTRLLSDPVSDKTSPHARLLAAIDTLGLRSLVSVPLYEGVSLVGTLTVGMANSARAWSSDEVTLIESVASQARGSVESARLQQRERNIATQLQDSLQPPSPPPVAGVSLAHFYRPALAEARVGGDFFDVFPVRETCTALVVADLSGKGLAAAQQVATVRNMLRFAVYSEPHLGQAISRLHQIMVDNNLLTGFATLFIGCYDPTERTLTYVNCGQEPGLIWRRTTRTIEELSPTGPILGGFSGGEFQQTCIALSDGDVFALFTDGLTEVGPSRAQLLEVEGVRALLMGCCADTADNRGIGHDSHAIKDRLIAGVDAYARGGVRDDIALLVGVVGNRLPESEMEGL